MDPDEIDREFQKAKLDNEVLRSVVNPLEEEVRFLRKKVQKMMLNESFEPVKTDESELAKLDLPQMMIRYHILDGPSFNCNINQVNSILEDFAMCENEKNSLHLYISKVLNENENLSEENQKLMNSITKLGDNLKREQEKFTDLQNTWKRANENFVEQHLSMVNQLEEVQRQLANSKPTTNSDISDQSQSSLGNSSVDNMIVNLENEKQRLVMALNKTNLENVSLNEAVIRQKMAIADMEETTNQLNIRLKEMIDVHSKEIRVMQTSLDKLLKCSAHNTFIKDETPYDDSVRGSEHVQPSSTLSRNIDNGMGHRENN